MAVIDGVFVDSSTGKAVNGATAKLWQASAFATPPAKNTALPGAGQVGSAVTTGVAHGGDGAYRFTNVAVGSYYISIEYNGNIGWESAQAPIISLSDTLPTITTISLAANRGRFKGEPSFDIMAYGAAGDGSTDDTTAVQAAIDAAAVAGGIVNGSGKTYRVTSTLDLASDVHLRDMTLDGSTISVSDNIVEGIGSAAGAITLNADASEGDTSIELTSTSGVATNVWLRISSNAVFGSTSQPRGELVRVASVAGPTVTLYDPLADSYALADSAQVQVVTFMENVRLERVNIIGPADGALSITGVYLDMALDVVVRDCTFTRTHHNGVALRDVVAARIDGCHFDRIEKTGLAYGVAVLWACQDVTVSGCTGTRLRHLVTVGGGTGRPGIARRIVASACTISQAMEAGFDCHPAGEEISFVGNSVYGSDGVGIVFQAPRGIVANNSVRDTASHGISVQHLSNESLDVVVQGNAVRDAAGRGILVQTNTGFAAVHGVVISANSVRDSASTAIDVDGSGGGSQLVGVAITGNIVRGAGSHPINLRNVDYVTVTGNVIDCATSSVSGIRLLTVARATVNGNLVRFTSSTSTQCIRLVPGDDCAVVGNSGTGAAIGVMFDANSENNTVIGNNMRGNTTPLSLSSGTGNISDTGDASGAYNAI